MSIERMMISVAGFPPKGHGVTAGFVVTVNSAMMGDVTGDNKLTVSNIVKLRAIIMGNGIPTGAQFAVGDINNDKALIVSDIVSIRSIIIGYSQNSF